MGLVLPGSKQPYPAKLPRLSATDLVQASMPALLREAYADLCRHFLNVPAAFVVFTGAFQVLEH